MYVLGAAHVWCAQLCFSLFPICIGLLRHRAQGSQHQLRPHHLVPCSFCHVLVCRTSLVHTANTVPSVGQDSDPLYYFHSFECALVAFILPYGSNDNQKHMFVYSKHFSELAPTYILLETVWGGRRDGMGRRLNTAAVLDKLKECQAYKMHHELCNWVNKCRNESSLKPLVDKARSFIHTDCWVAKSGPDPATRGTSWLLTYSSEKQS